jgi:VCBS repeat-containing protein
VGPIGNVNDAPTTAPVTLAPIAEDSGARLITQAELLANAGDADGDDLTATGLAITSGNGSLVDNGDGTWTYTPAQNDNTAVGFSYTISDGAVGVAASATLDITPVNDAPAIDGGTGAVSEDVDPDANGLLEVGGVLSISDPDVGESSFQAGNIVGTYGRLTIDAAGSWRYAADNTQAAIQLLDAGESLTDVLTVTTADGTTHTITITINGAADAPVIDESPGPVDEGAGDPDPGDEVDPVETEPDEVLPIEEVSPPPEVVVIPNSRPLETLGVTGAQWNRPRHFAATIALMKPEYVYRNDNESPAVDAAFLNSPKRGPAFATEGNFVPAATVYFSPEVMAQALDHLQKQIDDTIELDLNQGQLIIGAATGLGASVMVGYVVWAFRGASLLLGALSAMPMWRCFDPLPVLIGNDKKRDEDAEEKSSELESEDDEKRVRDLLDSEQAVNAHQAHNGRRN